MLLERFPRHAIDDDDDDAREREREVFCFVCGGSLGLEGETMWHFYELTQIKNENATVQSKDIPKYQMRGILTTNFDIIFRNFQK